MATKTLLATAHFHGFFENCFGFLTFLSLFIACLSCRPNPPCLSCLSNPPPTRCTDYKICGITFETMKQVLAETESQIRDNRVRLPFTPPKALKKNTILVNSGDTASFSCPVRNMTENLVWTHQNKHIPYVRWNATQLTSVSNAPFLYSFVLDNVKQQVNLSIHGASLSAAGEVQCLEPCNGNGSVCPTRAFTLKVRPSAAEIFARPLSNQSTSSVAPTFICDVKARYSMEEFHRRIMWRFNKRIISAHPEHPFDVLQPYPENVARSYRDSDHAMYGISNKLQLRYFIGFRSTMNEEVFGSVMQIQNATLHLPGRVECWFQVDPDNDEWLINAAYLNPVT